MQQGTDAVDVLRLGYNGGLILMTGCLQTDSFYGKEKRSCLDETPGVDRFWKNLWIHDTLIWCEDV